jgi:hypothetical protein
MTLTEKLKRIARVGLAVVATVYLGVGGLFFVPYYNWRYAQEHGFIKWLLLGEVVPTLKGVAWPYSVVADAREARRKGEERRAEAVYTRELERFMAAGDAAKTEMLLLVGRALGESESKGEVSALAHLADGLEVVLRRHATALDELNRVAPPPSCAEFHGLLVSSHARSHELARQFVLALRVGDMGAVERLRVELNEDGARFLRDVQAFGEKVERRQR